MELPPRHGLRYRGFADPSGGRHDAYCLAIGHFEGTRTDGRFVLDVLRGAKPPFDPQTVTKGYAGLLREYGLHEVVRRQLRGGVGRDARSGTLASSMFAPTSRRAHCISKPRRCLRVAAFRCRTIRCCCVSYGCWSVAPIAAAGILSIMAAQVTMIMPTRCWAAPR